MKLYDWCRKHDIELITMLIVAISLLIAIILQCTYLEG